MVATATHATSVGGHQPLPAMPVSVAAVAFHRAFAGPLAPLPRPLCGEAGDIAAPASVAVGLAALLGKLSIHWMGYMDDLSRDHT